MTPSFRSYRETADGAGVTAAETLLERRRRALASRLTAAFVLSIGLLSSALAQTATYTNNVFGYRLDYPIAWAVEAFGAGEAAVNFFDERAFVLVQAFESDPSDEGALEGWVERELAELSGELDDLTVVATEAATLAGVPALTALYTGVDPNDHARVSGTVAVAISELVAVIINAEAPSLLFDRYYAVFDAMVDSFAFTH